MSDHGADLGRRALLRGLGAGVGVAALAAAGEARGAAGPNGPDRTGPHTRATVAALVDAVVPETPGLAADRGAEHRPGGLAVGLDRFLVRYFDTLFEYGLPRLGSLGTLRLAGVVAGVLDAAATELLARGENEHEPGAYAPAGRDWSAGGSFAHLHREDRVRAIALLDADEKDLETADLPGPVVEVDAGLVAQLVVAFTEVVYYSEWQGYPEGGGLEAPPSERSHPNDPAAVQSWRQTGFPGNAEGYKALRGYAGRPDSSLGGGETWTVVRTGEGPPLHVTDEPGAFAENDYDTSDYEEVFPEADDERGSGDEDGSPGVLEDVRGGAG